MERLEDSIVVATLSIALILVLSASILIGLELIAFHINASD